MNYELYPSDLTDREWEYIKRLIPAAKSGGRKRQTDMGSSTFNRGHLHHLAILALRAFVGRPRGILGFHLRGGTLNESSSSTVQQ